MDQPLYTQSGVTYPLLSGYDNQIATTQVPNPLNTVMPTIANSSGGVPHSNTGLTPLSLSMPLPSIVTTAPVDLTPVDCGGFTQWVSDNPLAAVALIAGVGFLIHKGRG